MCCIGDEHLVRCALSDQGCGATPLSITVDNIYIVCGRLNDLIFDAIGRRRVPRNSIDSMLISRSILESRSVLECWSAQQHILYDIPTDIA
jgi:hypothetical protein